MMMTEFYDKVTERLMRYARIDTQSANDLTKTPTTQKQFNLARILKDELQSIGAVDVYLDEQHCVVYGKISSNIEQTVPTVGLIAHMDTAPDAPGDCKPWVLKKYNGSDIVLNQKDNIIMHLSDFPNLKNYLGQDLILTDGTTLLGGDDKASIAAIMTMAEYVCTHPEVKHGQISIAFTPDEEVGGLARDLDFKRFDSAAAYTMDGDHLGYYEDETFNASAVTVTIQGRSVHTGTAKGIMKNSVDIGNEYLAALPANEKPQYTSGREGFFHVVSFQGNCEKTAISLIVRDFDRTSFEIREKLLLETAARMNQQYGSDTIKVEITEQYRNMKEIIDQNPELVNTLIHAIRENHVEPIHEPFRGGTDGSSLSWRGLPSLNLSAGYENAHGRYEYVSIQSMVKNVQILISLLDITAGGKRIHA